jgi:hypothetical protein
MFLCLQTLDSACASLLFARLSACVFFSLSTDPTLVALLRYVRAIRVDLSYADSISGIESTQLHCWHRVRTLEFCVSSHWNIMDMLTTTAPSAGGPLSEGNGLRALFLPRRGLHPCLEIESLGPAYSSQRANCFVSMSQAFPSRSSHQRIFWQRK